MRLLIFGLVIFIIGLFACKKKPTVWESDWSVPLINDTLSLINLVNDSTLSVSSGGFYEMDLTRTLFNLNVNDLIDFKDTTITENFTLGFASLTLNPGFSFVNSTQQHVLNVAGVQLKKVIIKHGFIDMEVHNPVATTAIFKIILPGVTKEGVTFQQEYSAPSGTNSNPGIKRATIDLSGYEIDLKGTDGNSHNLLQSQVTVKTDPNGPTVTITNQDITRVKATFRNIGVDYARGYFGNRLISDTSSFYLSDIDLYESGILDLPNTSVRFIVENYMKAGAQSKMTLFKNENNLGNIVTLSSNLIGNSLLLDPATGSWNSLSHSSKELLFNNSNSNIEACLENLGAKNTIGYSIQLNPWGNVSGSWDEVYPGSALKVKVNVKMPLSLGMDALVLRDTFDLNFQQKVDATHIKSGSFRLKMTNAFPFSGTISLLLCDENNQVLHTIHGTSPIKSSKNGNLNPKHNLFTADSDILFELSDKVIADINKVKKVIVRSRFDSIDPSTSTSTQMLIPEGAFLSVKLSSKFTSENRMQ